MTVNGDFFLRVPLLYTCIFLFVSVRRLLCLLAVCYLFLLCVFFTVCLLLFILFLCVHYGLSDQFTCGCTCLCVMCFVICVTWGSGGIVTLSSHSLSIAFLASFFVSYLTILIVDYSLEDMALKERGNIIRSASVIYCGLLCS